MLREVIAAIREALINSERVAHLSREVSDQSRAVRSELESLHGEMREIRDRLARLEGGFTVLDRLGRLPD